MLQALAEKYASVLGTTILASREHDGVITFTLTSGPKYTMTEAELKQALDKLQGTPAKPAPPAVTETDSQEPGQAQPEATPKRKPRAK